MKILVNCTLPFALAHGGHAIQIQRTIAALREIGLDAEPLRWWDENQTGDLIHYFGLMSVDQIQFAHQKNIKVVFGCLLTAQGSQTPLQRGVRRLFRWFVETFTPRSVAVAFGWESYRRADACIVLTDWEKYLMSYKFGVDPQKVFVVTNGVEEVFFQSTPSERGPWLVCTATITERKRVLELAEAAIRAQVPVWIIGTSYADSDSYAQKFYALAKANPQFVRYEGGISDRVKLAAIYRAARGFVLLSTMESLSLSALEAAACECPLLLSDLPWARSSFPSGAVFCPVTDDTSLTAATLKKFHDNAPSLPLAPKPATWVEVARQLHLVYQKIM